MTHQCGCQHPKNSRNCRATTAQRHMDRDAENVGLWKHRGEKKRLDTIPFRVRKAKMWPVELIPDVESQPEPAAKPARSKQPMLNLGE